jgi:hypothetical protein
VTFISRIWPRIPHYYNAERFLVEDPILKRAPWPLSSPRAGAEERPGGARDIRTELDVNKPDCCPRLVDLMKPPCRTCRQP